MEIDWVEFIVNTCVIFLGLYLMRFSFVFSRDTRRLGALVWKEVGFLGMLVGFFVASSSLCFVLASLFLDSPAVNFNYQAAGCLSLLFLAYHGARYTKVAVDRIEEAFV